MARLARLGVLCLGVGMSRTLAAQSATGVQLEARADLIAARNTSLQLGGAVNTPAGRYVRVGAALGGGVAWHDGATRGAARADLLARFVLDPFREAPLGLYGIGGVSVMHDGFEHTRPRLLVGVGVESRIRGQRVVAGELGLGGGVRLALVVRRARRTGR